MGKEIAIKSKTKKRNGIHLKDEIEGTLFACIPFVGFILFTLFPMGLSLVVSFTELKSYDITLMKFVGFQNFRDVINYRLFWKSIVNSLFWTLSVPLTMGTSLFLANLLSKKHKFSKPVRILLFVPQVCSGVAVSLMFTWIFEANYGVINTILSKMGLPKIRFMQDPYWFRPSVLLIALWQSGTNVIIMQSALANVNEVLKEAARIDGATETQIFWKVVFPSITPTLFYLFTMQMISAMQEMAIFQILTTNGVGPEYQAVTMTYLLYRMAFTNTATEGLGMASAMSWLVAILIIVITRISFKISDKWVTYD